MTSFIGVMEKCQRLSLRVASEVFWIRALISDKISSCLLNRWIGRIPCKFWTMCLLKVVVVSLKWPENSTIFWKIFFCATPKTANKQITLAVKGTDIFSIKKSKAKIVKAETIALFRESKRTIPMLAGVFAY